MMLFSGITVWMLLSFKLSQAKYRVELPGYPILGDGKSAARWTWVFLHRATCPVFVAVTPGMKRGNGRSIPGKFHHDLTVLPSPGFFW